jgi:hypothetical protein
MPKEETPAPFLSTDTEKEAVDSLEMAARFLEEAPSNPAIWKWALIAINTAVQKIMTLALSGTWPVGTYSQQLRERQLGAHYDLLKAIEAKDKDAIREAEKRDRKVQGESHLAGFLWLYGRIKDEDQWAMTHWGNEKVLVPGPTCNFSMACLKVVRDDYLHFAPGSRLHSLSHFTTIAIDALSVIDFLVNQTPLISWTPRAEDEERAKTALMRARAATEILRRMYPELPRELLTGESTKTGRS